MAKKTDAHWTAKSISDMAFAVASDFVIQIENKLVEQGLENQDEWAKKLGIEKRLLQIYWDHPELIPIEQMVRFAKAVGVKMALPVYDDGDPDYQHGPVLAPFFANCWEILGKPSCKRALEEFLKEHNIAVDWKKLGFEE